MEKTDKITTDSPDNEALRNAGKKLQSLCITTLSAMAQGLFASLLIGTMISTLGEQIGLEVLVELGTYAKSVTGAAMAVAIGYALGAAPLQLFSLATVGQIANSLGGSGGPFAVLVVTCFLMWTGKYYSQKTKFDMILTPFLTIIIGYFTAAAIAPPIGVAVTSFGNTITWATALQPFFMGMILSVLVGMALTLPISSAAICAGLGLTGLAGGAALAGCCAQMVGFATMSYKENGFSGLISQGIGTSMLQMANITKNPYVWLPPILTSAVTGPLSTMVFRLEMNGAAISSGMGTCGFVGQIGIYTGWLNDISEGVKTSITTMDYLGLFGICFVLPAILTPIFYTICVKMGLIKPGDVTL